MAVTLGLSSNKLSFLSLISFERLQTMRSKRKKVCNAGILCSSAGYFLFFYNWWAIRPTSPIVEEKARQEHRKCPHGQESPAGHTIRIKNERKMNLAERIYKEKDRPVHYFFLFDIVDHHYAHLF